MLVKKIFFLFLAFSLLFTHLPVFPIAEAYAQLNKNEIPQCKLLIDLKQGLYFSDINKNCCKTFGNSTSERKLVNEVEPTISKDLKDFTLIETEVAHAVLMIGGLATLELITIGTKSNAEAFGLNLENLTVGRLPSFIGCGNGRVESSEECDDGNLFNTDSCSNECKKITPGGGPQISSTGGNELKFSDPFTGKIFSKEEITSITKPNASNIRRIRLEKAVGDCVFNSICSSEDNFEKNTGGTKSSVLAGTIDKCLDENIELLSGANIGERISQCSLNIDFANGSYSGNINQSCCSSIGNTGVQSRTSNGGIEKEIREYVLIVVLVIITVLLSAGLYGLKALDSDLRASYQERRSELLARAAEAGAAERLGSLVDPDKQIFGGIFFDIEDEEVNEDTSNGTKIDPSLLKGPRGIRITKKILEKRKKNLEDYLSLCTEDILCTLKDKTFFNEGKIYQNAIPIILNVCLNDIGIRLRSSIGNPCICTENGCACTTDSVCKGGMCKNQASCKCNSKLECLCPESVVCKNVQCDDKENCKCLDTDLCTTDNDCNAQMGEVCDSDKNVCVPPTSCRKDDDCDSTKMCNTNKRVCIPKSSVITCTTDNDCKSGQMCDSTKSVCVKSPKIKPGKCTTNTDCKNGEVCDGGNHSCTNICTSDNDCSTGKMCEPTKKICVSKPPVATCTSDNDCDSTKMCDQTKKVCVIKTIPICKSSSECKSGELCNQGKCEVVKSCVQPPPGSFAQNPCPVGQFCFENRCWSISCTIKEDCPRDHICDTGSCMLAKSPILTSVK